MENSEKEKQIIELGRLLNDAFTISNDLVGQEESAYSHDGEILYSIREWVNICKERLKFIRQPA